MGEGKTAIITGITGQDGSYLAELLLDKGYTVYGLVRRTSQPTQGRNLINHLMDNDNFNLVNGDLTDQSSIDNAVKEIQPDEFYNLGAQSFVPESWRSPTMTADVTGLGALRCLEAIKLVKPDCKFYQAGSSEQFGDVREIPQNELTPFYPRSPYGCAKVFAYDITRNYRESYGLFACTGILFNHESPRRGLEFVTRKVTMTVARIAKGLDECLSIGNVKAKRDWGFAGDYVEMQWRMLQQENPEDFVVLRCLEAIKLVKPDCKFYQAGSSEQFGDVREIPQNELTPFYPRSPYGCAKVFAYDITRNYRESYGLFACTGILFNHESPRRGLEFVTRKVTMTVARIAKGCLLYTSPSPRDRSISRMPSSA